MGRPPKPEERMSAAIRIVDEAIKKTERELQELLRTRETLLRLTQGSIGKKTSARKHNDLDYAARDLEGLRLTDAIKAVLNLSGPLALVALKDSLERRGARLGVPDKPQRFAANLKTAVINSPARFKYDAKTDTVSLVNDEDDTERSA